MSLVVQVIFKWQWFQCLVILESWNLNSKKFKHIQKLQTFILPDCVTVRSIPVQSTMYVYTGDNMYVHYLMLNLIFDKQCPFYNFSHWHTAGSRTISRGREVGLVTVWYFSGHTAPVVVPIVFKDMCFNCTFPYFYIQ